MKMRFLYGRHRASSMLLALAASVAVLTGATLHAQDSPPLMLCLDTMAINSSSVLVGKIVEIEGPVRSGDNHVVVNVEKVLKGNDPSGRNTVRIDAPLKDINAWKNQGSRLLIFDGHFMDMAFGSVQPNVIDLSAQSLKVLTANLKTLDDPNQILQATQRAIDRHPGVDRIPTFQRSVWGVFVTEVPVDSDLERWAISAMHSTDDMERDEAAKALRYFPSVANEERLKQLLGDPALTGNGPGRTNFYFVRQSAYASLKQMGVTVPKPVIEKKPIPQ